MWRRKENVNGRLRPAPAGLTSGLALNAEARQRLSRPTPERPQVSLNGDDMSVVVFIVLTVAIFALLGLVQKLVERL
jgi:hypothetical protein